MIPAKSTSKATRNLTPIVGARAVDYFEALPSSFIPGVLKVLGKARHMSSVGLG